MIAESIVFALALTLAATLQEVDQDNDFISVDQQVQIVADVSNSQDRIQNFAYLVQIQDQDDVTVSLAWLTGALSPKQTLSPALSWIPKSPGSYTATIFVWESVDNPSALSPPLVLPLVVK